MSELDLDTSFYKELGMTLLTKEEVDSRPRATSVEWPKETPFNPEGITLEEAREAMKRM